MPGASAGGFGETVAEAGAEGCCSSAPIVGTKGATKKKHRVKKRKIVVLIKNLENDVSSFVTY
jgi:hypothetical protein